MQRKNAVAAVRCGVEALCSAHQTKKHVAEPRAKSSLFHNAVS
jgi:hypothetical protein